MRLISGIALFVLMISSCTKEDSFLIPLHTESLDWLMESKTHIYTNSNGDSISSTSVSQQQAYISEGYDESLNYPKGTQGERIIQTVAMDTLFDYTTVLLAEINDNARLDKVTIDAINLSILGDAYPVFALSTNYNDSIIFNGITYYNVYHKVNTVEGTGIFVNLDQGLIAFIAEKDTFNLVN